MTPEFEQKAREFQDALDRHSARTRAGNSAAIFFVVAIPIGFFAAFVAGLGLFL